MEAMWSNFFAQIPHKIPNKDNKVADVIPKKELLKNYESLLEQTYTIM